MNEDHVIKSSPGSHVRPPSSLLQQKVVESSPTDRVEKLLRKYKSRQVVRKTSADKLSRQLLNEDKSWKALMVELDSHIPYHSGVKNVVITTPPATGTACQDVESSIALRGTITTLLDQLREKDATLQDFHVSSPFRTTGPHATQATPTKKQYPIIPQRMDRVTSVPELEEDFLVERLRSQVTRLEYENAKLKIDLQNRPELHELKKCQRKIKELETALQQSRRLLSSEQVDCLQSQQEIENVCLLLRVSRSEDVAPKIHAMMDVIESQGRLEKHLLKVLQMVYHPAAPKWAWHGDFPPGDLPRPVDHHIWCEVTWDHVVLTLQEWLSHLHGLQELDLVFTEVCQRFEYTHHRMTGSRHPGKTSRHKQRSSVHQVSLPRHTTTDSASLITEDEGDGLVVSSLGRGDEEGGTCKLTTRGKRPQLSALEIAGLLRHWLLDKGHLKHASVQSVLAMVRHFQQLFDVPHLDGVYTAMSRLYQQIEQSKNIFKQLKSCLQLDSSCSNRELISSMEYLTSQQNSQLLLQIEREFGPLDVSEIMEKLRLCNEFFPAFHDMVTELQEFLGVSSIGDITSAIYNL